MNRRLLTVAALTVFSIVGAALIPVGQPPVQERVLGTISFPNSGSREAQSPFIEGVLLLHSFEFEDAATSFREAQGIDPEFALAYWGEAMRYNQTLWRQQDKEAALSALERYAATADERQEKAPTVREASYLASVDILYAEGSETERDLAYMAAMSRLTSTYTEDLEARTFYTLSILGSTNGERDFATYMKAATAV